MDPHINIAAEFGKGRELSNLDILTHRSEDDLSVPEVLQHRPGPRIPLLRREALPRISHNIRRHRSTLLLLHFVWQAGLTHLHPS